MEKGRDVTGEFAGKAALAASLSVVAIAAAPLVMGPSYEVLQPRLGPMTLIVVEVSMRCSSTSR